MNSTILRFANLLTYLLTYLLKFYAQTQHKLGDTVLRADLDA